MANKGSSRDRRQAPAGKRGSTPRNDLNQRGSASKRKPYGEKGGYKSRDAEAGRSAQGGRDAAAGRGTRSGGDGAAGRGTRSGGIAVSGRSSLPEQTLPGQLLKSARRKGEWLEIRLPDAAARENPASMLRYLPIPPKLAGRLLNENGVVKNGSLLKIKLFPKERAGIEPDWMEMNVLYEDDFLLVVGKPTGVEVHPSAQGQRGTLAHAVAAYYEATGQACRVRPVHRLDKDTTGPVLFAKNEFANVVFEKAMKEKKIDRLYLAVAEGIFEETKGVIDKPIGQDRHHSTRRRVSETGEHAVTRYEVVEQFDEHALLRLKLETGRTHQIRVHLSFTGHPIAGDGMYGGTRRYIHRQALHGEKLMWNHPWHGERMQVHAPLPEDMVKLLKELRSEMKRE